MRVGDLVVRRTWQTCPLPPRHPEIQYEEITRRVLELNHETGMALCEWYQSQSGRVGLSGTFKVGPAVLHKDWIPISELDRSPEQKQLDQEHEDGARQLYAVYGASADWKNVRGEPMPKWNELGDAVRGHWTAVAAAARTLYF